MTRGEAMEVLGKAKTKAEEAWWTWIKANEELCEARRNWLEVDTDARKEETKT